MPDEKPQASAIEWADPEKRMIGIRPIGWFRIYCALPDPLDGWFLAALWRWRRLARKFNSMGGRHVG